MDTSIVRLVCILCFIMCNVRIFTLFTSLVFNSTKIHNVSLIDYKNFIHGSDILKFSQGVSIDIRVKHLLSFYICLKLFYKQQ
jgi:hypothetical protein